jgi:type III secretion system FlhB-like substrate exporter
MRSTRGARGEGRIGCILWLAVLGLIGYGLYKIVPVKIATSTFYDFMQEEAAFGSIRGVKQLEKELLAKAKELDVPVTEDNLTINRTRENITIEAHYTITVEFFNGWKKYVWKFDQVVSRPTFLV